MSDSWSFGTHMPLDSGAAAEAHGAHDSGEFFGPYQIQDVLGEGANGVVYRASGPAGRDVAVKVLKSKLDADRRERFRREGEVAAKFTHPGILRVLSGGEIGGQPYLVYELVPSARELDTYLATLDLAGRVGILRDVARAVGYAHAHGVVHRDLKGSNVLVDDMGRPRVADFGLAKDASLDRLTQTGALLGTPLAMAPEQIVSDLESVGPPTDVWALGVMLYEALSGEHPFQANSFQELMARVTLANPKRLRSLNPEVSTDLEAICAKALAGEIDSRYADGTALAEDLDAYLAGERPLAAGDRPAVHRGVILLGSLIAIAVAVAMFAPTHPPAAAPPVARGTVERTNDPETRDPPLDAASEQEGDAAWREIRGVEDPQERMAQAHAWCESFPNHSGLTRAKAFLEREHYTHPTRVLKHAEGLRVLPSFRPDGSLDTLGLDKRHLIWDPRRGKVIRRWTVPHLQWSRREPGRVFIAVRLPDGLVFSGERLPLYRLRRGRATDVESGVRGARALAVSPNGALLAVGRRNQSVTIYDTVTGEAGRSFPFKASRATSLCFTGDGKRLWVFGGLEQDVFDGGLKDAHCFDLASGKRVVARTTKGYISASVFGPDLIVGPQEGSVQVWDAQGNSVGLFRDGQWDLAGPVQDLAVSLDQTVLYVLRNKGSDAASEHQIALWNVATREPIRPPIVRPGPMTALSLSPDGRSLAVGTESGRVEIWEFPTLAPPSEREFESKAPFRRKSRVGPRATISASPSTVLVKGPTGKGSTTLTWDTSGFPGKVRPSVWVFRSKLDQGRRVARDFGDTRLIPWILADEVYTFRVFVGPTPSGELLATTVVRGKLAPRSSE